MESTQRTLPEKYKESSANLRLHRNPAIEIVPPSRLSRSNGLPENHADYSDFADYFIPSGRILLMHHNGRRSQAGDMESDMLSL